MREFVKFMLQKINDCIWGGNDRLCSLKRGKRVLFTVSAGWTRHGEWDKYLPAPEQYLLQSLRWLRNLSRRCRRVDRSHRDGRAPYITAHVICTHGDLLVGLYRFCNNIGSTEAIVGDVVVHLLSLDQVVASGVRPVPPNRGARLSSFRGHN